MKFRSLLIAFFIVIATVAAVAGLYTFRPTTSKVKPVVPVPLVNAQLIEPCTEEVFIEAFGTVVPARQVELYAEVEGRIMEQNPELVPGGILPKGSLLVQIDPRDYQLIVRERQADLVEAETKLSLEKGQQNIASREWQLFRGEKEMAEVNEQLALREPHLKSALAQVEAARSRLEAAKLDEQRTIVRTPFNSLVLEEYVETGQLIGRQTPIAKLVETDSFWVRVSVSPADLARVRFAGPDNEEGSSVEVIMPGLNRAASVRHGRVFKLLGDLDPKGRMARILVSIQDPLNLQQGEVKAGSPGKILLGSYVKVRIAAGSLDNVYVIPREAMRENDRIWVLTVDNRLAIRASVVKWRRQEEVLVATEISPGEKVIISRLQSPLPGMALRTEDSENTP